MKFELFLICFFCLCLPTAAVGGIAKKKSDVTHMLKSLKKQVAELNGEVVEQKAEIKELTNKILVISEKLNVSPVTTVTASSTARNASAFKVGGKEEEGPFEWDFVGGFLSSISMIIVSELGDKTFFIAAIMAMRNSRRVIFLAAIAALAIMTVLSAAMGFALPNLMPRKYTHYAATGLFVFFGFRLIYDSITMEVEEENEEMKEVEEELAAEKKKNEDKSVESGEKKKKTFLGNFFSPIFIQCFTMTFLAEWGDRSQIATIALAAHKDPIGVTVGGVIGHALCTCLAVIGGKLLATSISERAVALTGGILFCIFAVHSLWVGA